MGNRKKSSTRQIIKWNPSVIELKVVSVDQDEWKDRLAIVSKELYYLNHQLQSNSSSNLIHQNHNKLMSSEGYSDEGEVLDGKNRTEPAG